MKKIYIVLGFLIILGSCTSSRKYLERGQYDLAVRKSVKKLMKNPTKSQEIATLKRAFELANQKNTDNINSLRFSGQPDIWESVFYNYDQMRTRQEIVERLPREVLMQIGQQHVDYNQMRAEAKRKAAEFLYAHAQELLKTNNRQDARKAYSELVRLNKFYPNYPNVRSLMDQATLIGTNNVLFKIRNQSRQVMPKGFENELLKITLKRLNKQWLNFDTRENTEMYYDYTIYLNIKAIDKTPERIKELHYDETKRVRDGDKYVLDQNGNVQKDSLGNDVKVPNYINITAHVVENRMEKSARVHGTLDFYDNRENQLVKTFPITTENTFLYRFGYATGNLKALKDETKKFIGLKAIPFPSDLQIIYDTNEDLKKIAYDLVAKNRNYLVN